jgi:uncharacterized protein (DUF4415 family)
MTSESKTRIELPSMAPPQAALVSELVDVTIRLDRDVVQKFMATGPGWRERMRAVLGSIDSN